MFAVPDKTAFCGHYLTTEPEASSSPRTIPCQTHHNLKNTSLSDTTAPNPTLTHYAQHPLSSLYALEGSLASSAFHMSTCSHCFSMSLLAPANFA